MRRSAAVASMHRSEALTSRQIRFLNASPATANEQLPVHNVGSSTEATE